MGEGLTLSSEVTNFLWALPVAGSTRSGLWSFHSVRAIHESPSQTGSGMSSTRLRRSASFTSCAVLSLRQQEEGHGVEGMVQWALAEGVVR